MSKRFAIRGLMLDMVRVTERYEHYLDVTDAMPGWGYNTLFAHITDNEGCAVAFDSRPELASPKALSKDQVRQWIGRAESQGVSIVPEIECFGHTKFIHGHPSYKHLAMPASGHFNAINPLHPDTHAVLEDLITESAELFDSPYIHAGFDEVNLGDTSVLGEPAKNKTPWELYADMVCTVYSMISPLGKRMMIWGDHLVSEPRIAERIPDDIIVCDWQYHGDLNDSSTKLLLDLGFEVVCCPASIRSGDMLMPRANTLDNLQRFSRIAHGAGDRVLGLMNTAWCPGRLLCGTELFAHALGGAWFQGPEADPVPVMRHFLAERFGIEQPGTIAETLLDLSVTIPHNAVLRRVMQTEASSKAPASPITAGERRQVALIAEKVASLRSTIESARSQVTKNQGEYDGFLLVCDVIAWLDRLAGFRLDEASCDTLPDLLEKGNGLLDRCKTDWARRRYEDDPYRDNDPYSESDGLISNFTKALNGLDTAEKPAESRVSASVS